MQANFWLNCIHPLYVLSSYLCMGGIQDLWGQLLESFLSRNLLEYESRGQRGLKITGNTVGPNDRKLNCTQSICSAKISKFVELLWLIYSNSSAKFERLLSLLKFARKQSFKYSKVLYLLRLTRQNFSC